MGEGQDLQTDQQKIMKQKKFKDPIYGYVEIDEKLVQEVIDTATFQRLRDIRQTSYAPLYPSALHNRFVHSIGVYYLGQIAFDALEKSLLNHKTLGSKVLGDLFELFDDLTWERYRFLFRLACLLHDVGHAPFSHTGENAYKMSRSHVEMKIDNEDELKENIEKAETETEKEVAEKELKKAKEYHYLQHLYQLTQDKVFVSSSGENPAAHEIMSSIVALETFENLFNSYEEKAFFARCVTGLPYMEMPLPSREEYMNKSPDELREIRKKLLLDCMIRLLNSTVIDVDRLDYLLRDASVMGYKSVSIDYQRLLGGIVVTLSDKYNFTVGFHKNAISIIENVVYAHDNEKKWVQGHPVILYDSYLLQQSIEYIQEEFNKKNPEGSTLFSYDSLTEKGCKFENINVRYLCDADLVFLMKNIYYDSNLHAKEYFNRNIRRHPLWKSEAEYRNLFSEEDRKKIDRVMRVILVQSNKASIEVNREELQNVRDELEAERNKKKNNAIKIETLEDQVKYLSAILKACKDNGIGENVLLLSTSFFKSNFSKDDMKNIFLFFPDGKPACRLESVSTILTSSALDNDELVYLFYYPQKDNKINIVNFVKELLSGLSDDT